MSQTTEHRRFAAPDDVREFPNGRAHDPWLVSDEPVIVVDWYGCSSYAR